MQHTRKAVKALHTVAAAGLTGGLLAYIALLVAVRPADVDAVAELRVAIAALSNYVLLPSLAVALVSGLLSMVVHKPFLDKGWVWIKAALGILMFKGVLTIVGAKANYAAELSAAMQRGEAGPDALQAMLTLEWWTVIAILAISIANFVLGIWRPNLSRSPAGNRRSAAPSSTTAAARPTVAWGSGLGTAHRLQTPRPAQRDTVASDQR